MRIDEISADLVSTCTGDSTSYNEKFIEVHSIIRGYIQLSLEELYKECEHGDDEHRQRLKDKFDDFLNRKINE